MSSSARFLASAGVLWALSAPAQVPRFRPTAGEEARVRLTLEWRIEDARSSLRFDREPYPSLAGRYRFRACIEGRREVVWRDHWLSLDDRGAPASYRRTWERLRGSDASRVTLDWLGVIDEFESELDSPLEGRTCVARREDGAWVVEWPEDDDPDLPLFDRLAWDVGLEALLPEGGFVYVDGVACRELLRPIGWPPWVVHTPSRWVEHRLLSSPLAYPRLDDPRLVIRRRSASPDELACEIELEIRETIDLAEAAEALHEGASRGLFAGQVPEEARLELEVDGRGWLRWAAAERRPREVTLDIELELTLRLDLASGLGLEIDAEGRMRQHIVWESVEPR